ncbi:hypothetical protein GIB67_000857 [Kingdonia uniflora]|uniref:RRM domain-containing protein n=1 Tax=Kingdonia uniflora TaxID=39325 RepID=A0A7J7LFP4_9MAGN|nr:hypothetical protein GIB67_000857 [Kingdonia uniflora]
MTPANLASQFGDTTYTKVFVGGLAWETQRETMRKYFEQFGQILEAVVITDKNTGRSKGYGFVTFQEADAAMKACVDAAPVIDGRRANCNLASLGVQRSRPSTPKHGGGGSRNFRAMNSFNNVGAGAGLQSGVATTAGATAFASVATFPAHYGIQQGIPTAAYNVYGYSPYSTDFTYPAGYYNVYGGQYPMYGAGTTGGMVTGTTAAATAYYPYLTEQSGYNLQYPQYHHLYQYSGMNSNGYPHHYGGPMSLAPTPNTPPVCFTLQQQNDVQQLDKIPINVQVSDVQANDFQPNYVQQFDEIPIDVQASNVQANDFQPNDVQQFDEIPIDVQASDAQTKIEVNNVDAEEHYYNTHSSQDGDGVPTVEDIAKYQEFKDFVGEE